MRCRSALEQIARLSGKLDSQAQDALASHIHGCASCSGAYRRHLALLAELDDPAPLPEFGDLAPRVLAGLRAPAGGENAFWRWAAAAALVVAASSLGFLFGSQDTDLSGTQDTMASTYAEALTATPSGPAEIAYAEVQASAPGQPAGGSR